MTQEENPTDLEQKTGGEKEDELNERIRPPRGVYLLPNLFTTSALFAGFYSIIAAINGDFENAAIAIFVAMAFDTLDGRVARMANAQSAFGAEYDSLSDVIAFGLAPALVAFLWALNDLGKVGWVCSFIYVAGTALRLARFNTQLEFADKRFFIGLASPAAAALVASIVWTFSAAELDIDPADLSIPFAAIVAFAGIMMVSNFRFYSFKVVNNQGRIPFVYLLAVVFVFSVVALDPAKTLLTSSIIYAFHGPIYEAWRKLFKKKAE